MTDVTLLADNELTKELHAFYEFIRDAGSGYLNEDGHKRFYQLITEYSQRRAEKNIDGKQNE